MYRGRFAPSPSGPLHFGSLVCALASYLDAKSNHGEWLVRIEDIDPPREIPGATDAILLALQKHGLHWDGELSLQSQRGDCYRKVLDQLDQQGLSYRCSCIRKRLKTLDGFYDQHCLFSAPPESAACAIRLNIKKTLTHLALHQSPRIIDTIQGVNTGPADSAGDFIIHRKDGLFAYQLAVSCDDAAQGITHVVRGSDLLDTTPQQLLLLSYLGAQLPTYSHIPVMCGEDGDKLSKQTFAPAICNEDAALNLVAALRALNFAPPKTLETQNCAAILQWGIEHWDLAQIPKIMALPASKAWT